jgi:hypothetical protein
MPASTAKQDIFGGEFLEQLYFAEKGTFLLCVNISMFSMDESIPL